MSLYVVQNSKRLRLKDNNVPETRSVSSSRMTHVVLEDDACSSRGRHYFAYVFFLLKNTFLATL